MFGSLSKNLLVLVLLLSTTTAVFAVQPDKGFELKPGDHICYIGNTMADRMQHDGWLETYIHATHPDFDLTFRNLGFAGDEVAVRPRSENFGDPDQWLSKCKADVVFCFFGYNEALRGEAALKSFETQLSAMIDGMLARKYNGNSPPRIVIFSPIGHENLNEPYLPDGKENNKKLALYTDAMRRICAGKGSTVTFVDLFTPSLALYQNATEPLTMNGIHLLDHGNQQMAVVAMRSLFPDVDLRILKPELISNIRDAVLDKNYYWFNRYRTVDGYNVYGGRSKLNWQGLSNFDVMQREMEMFDIMTANRDKRVWAVAKGGDLQVVDDNLPPPLVVPPNEQSAFQASLGAYLGGTEAIAKMKVAPGMEVNLFASEEMFPEMANPVQMAVDTDSRLFVAVWPSYPHWNPTEPRKDKIICLPDDDGDGVADRCVVFADQLNSITGFEFWGGGMLVAAAPEIWFLKDTDGDDKADLKIRMLQGVPSADTHHTANSLLIGPDGGLYWSQGVFNVTNMETPTKTFRSTTSGVYRFDPRSFEIDFHFPIGPNPHGDVFDQWGYQFATDGTGGTGSYIDIGKGIGNKEWYKKRVRPVPATGILSSSHFPEKNNGNFLICNAIGVLGVLQHEVKYNGADITAEEIEPIVISSDPNFRPTDLEIGGDGALYVSDWYNALIGHMQHNMRDPNRDHIHGRIYRITCPGRPLLKPVKMKGKPIETVLQSFYAKENGTRYRARLELSGRRTDDVIPAVTAWAEGLDPKNEQQAQALLECLWVFEEHRVPNLKLLKKVFTADEPRVRAAAIRTLGHWGNRVSRWEPVLTAAARDDSALVRAEAVKAAVSFDGRSPAEIIFEVATRPTDPELDTVLKYAKGQIKVDAMVRDAIESQTPLSDAARQYALQSASAAVLLKMERSEDVFRAILGRKDISIDPLREAMIGLAELRKCSGVNVLLEVIDGIDAHRVDGNLEGLGKILTQQPSKDLSEVRDRLGQLATNSKSPVVRRIGYAAWIVADESGTSAFDTAFRTESSLRDALGAISLIPDQDLQKSLFETVRPIQFALPANLQKQTGTGSLESSGIRVDYYQPNPDNVAIETLQAMTPVASGVVPEITIDVPQLKSREQFALRFTGSVIIPTVGTYRFFTSSDDGSRLYINGELVVDNDGLHGMKEAKGEIDLPAGPAAILVSYFDNGGGDGLEVSWAGPGFKKTPLPGSALSVSDGAMLHDAAIAAIQDIPGFESEKFKDWSSLIRSGKYRISAIRALQSLPPETWSSDEIARLAESLATYITEIPAKYRTGKIALDAMRLTDQLASRLPEDQAREFQLRIADLKINIIQIGTVPERMIYDKQRLAVQAGRPVEFIFSNINAMPHNFVIAMPGTMEEVGMLAEATSMEPDAMARNYVPKSDKLLLSSKLLQPNESQALSFNAPSEPGIYPYICTYPGHWRRMFGALYVVKDLKSYVSDPEKYLAANPMEMKDELLKFTDRNTEWTYDALAAPVKMLSSGMDVKHVSDEMNSDHNMETGIGRSFEVAQSIFKVANCVACHQINGEGREFGPDLTKLDAKRLEPDTILRSILDPDKEIDEKYQNYLFLLDSGKTIKGLVVAETDDIVKVIVDPIASPEPTTINLSEIDERKKLSVSTMPKGLLNRLTEEEILDLITYIHTRGDKNHKLFQEGHLHKHP